MNLFLFIFFKLYDCRYKVDVDEKKYIFILRLSFQCHILSPLFYENNTDKRHLKQFLSTDVKCYMNSSLLNVYIIHNLIVSSK